MGAVPPTSRKVLAHIAHRMRMGFSGSITIECHDGGIQTCTVAERLNVKRLPDRGVDTPEQKP